MLTIFIIYFGCRATTPVRNGPSPSARTTVCEGTIYVQRSARWSGHSPEEFFGIARVQCNNNSNNKNNNTRSKHAAGFTCTVSLNQITSVCCVCVCVCVCVYVCARVCVRVCVHVCVCCV